MLASTLLISPAPKPVKARLCLGRVNSGPMGPLSSEIGALVESLRSRAVVVVDIVLGYRLSEGDLWRLRITSGLFEQLESSEKLLATMICERYWETEANLKASERCNCFVYCSCPNSEDAQITAAFGTKAA